MLLPAIAYAPALRILVSPLNCPECAVTLLAHHFRQRPQGSSLISRPQQNQSGPTGTARAGEATFFAPRPNAKNRVSPGTPPLYRAQFAGWRRARGEKTAIIRG
jgi:hypothetical protein